MRYNNKFFQDKETALAFKREHGGRLLHWNERARMNSRLDFATEISIAYDARGEVVNRDETPYCVAWNEK